MVSRKHVGDWEKSRHLTLDQLRGWTFSLSLCVCVCLPTFLCVDSLSTRKWILKNRGKTTPMLNIPFRRHFPYIFCTASLKQNNASSPLTDMFQSILTFLHCLTCDSGFRSLTSCSVFLISPLQPIPEHLASSNTYGHLSCLDCSSAY